MATEVTRYIKREVERELWARAAGRCQFQGCNRLVYKSPVTHERANISEKAHIYSFSKNGPRGWGVFISDKKKLNDVGNLMLVCHDCHEIIDQPGGETRYSAELLIEWKRQHEQRVRVVTGISAKNNSHVVLYGSKIGAEYSPLQPDEAMEAMFPNWYPADDNPIRLSMSCEHEDSTSAFWSTEADHLRAAFERYVRPRIVEATPNHFSVFAFANQPLLILLGTILTDKVPVEVYQLHRTPRTWKWYDDRDAFIFQVNRPKNKKGHPVLVFSLSANIDIHRITSILGEDIAIWELTIDQPHNDFLRSRQQLSIFSDTVRKLMPEISSVHGQNTPLMIFPAMPVACSVEFGRLRMPKADMPWIIYDQNNKLGKFAKAIEIGAHHE